MGETESNLLKFFYKNEEELINLESFTIEDIKKLKPKKQILIAIIKAI